MHLLLESVSFDFAVSPVRELIIAINSFFSALTLIKAVVRCLFRPGPTCPPPSLGPEEAIRDEATKGQNESNA